MGQCPAPRMVMSHVKVVAASALLTGQRCDPEPPAPVTCQRPEPQRLEVQRYLLPFAVAPVQQRTAGIDQRVGSKSLGANRHPGTAGSVGYDAGGRVEPEDVMEEWQVNRRPPAAIPVR